MANEAYTTSDREERVLELLQEGRESDEPWGRVNPMYVKEELDIKRQYANKALSNLVTAGWVRKPVTGLYEFAADPREE